MMNLEFKIKDFEISSFYLYFNIVDDYFRMGVWIDTKNKHAKLTYPPHWLLNKFMWF